MHFFHDQLEFSELKDRCELEIYTNITDNFSHLQLDTTTEVYKWTEQNCLSLKQRIISFIIEQPNSRMMHSFDWCQHFANYPKGRLLAGLYDNLAQKYYHLVTQSKEPPKTDEIYEEIRFRIAEGDKIDINLRPKYAPNQPYKCITCRLARLMPPYLSTDWLLLLLTNFILILAYIAFAASIPVLIYSLFSSPHSHMVFVSHLFVLAFLFMEMVMGKVENYTKNFTNQ